MFPRFIPLTTLWLSLLGSAVWASGPPQQDLSTVWSNPAQMPDFGERVPLLSTFSGRAYVNDSDRLLDLLVDTQEESQRLEQQANSSILLPSDMEPLIALLKRMDGRRSTSNAMAGFATALSHNDNQFALHFNMSGRSASRFVFDPDDEARLRAAPLLGAFFTTDLQSQVLISGALTGEAGLTYARTLDDDGKRRLGVTVKHQEIVLYQREVTLSEYSESKLYDRHRDLRRHHGANIDIGYRQHWRRLSAGLAVTNLVHGSYRGPLGDNFQLRPQFKLGLDYQHRWGSLALKHDITPQPGFAEVAGRRLTALDAGLPLGDHLQLKLGFQHVDKDRDGDAWRLGLRYQLLEAFHMEVRYDYASPRESGGQAQIQLLF